MEFIHRAGTDIYAFLILLLILFVSYSKIEKTFFSYRLFFYMVILTMVQLIIEALAWFIAYNNSFSLLIYILNCTFLTLNPFPPLLWVVYANYQLFDDEKRAKKLFFRLIVLIYINFAVVLIAPRNPLVFTPGNIPVISTSVVCFFYIVFTVIMTLFMYEKVDKKRFFSILFFSFPPVIGALLDIIFTEISVLWPSVVLSILFIYLNLQNYRVNTDSLTGLYNRNQLEYRLEKYIRSVKNGGKFGLVLIDINDFKLINDNYGHVQGDKAIEDVAFILKSCFRLTDFVSRYAGDEFIALVKVDENDNLVQIVERLNAAVDTYNRSAIIKVFLSIGYSVYDKSMNYTPKEFIDFVDNLMYVEKAKKGNTPSFIP